MDFPKWLRIVWWAAVTTGLTLLVTTRAKPVIRGDGTYVDVAIFVIWAALILIPLFGEVTVFGVTLKKEIEALKYDVGLRIANLAADVRSAVAVQTQVNPQINVGTLPGDAELAGIKEQLGEIIKLQDDGSASQAGWQRDLKPEVPETTAYLFSVRYLLEQEVSRIYKDHFDVQARSSPFSQAVELLNARVFHPQLVSALRDVMAICNSAIHGRPITPDAASFVRQVAPGLLALLKRVPQKGN